MNRKNVGVALLVVLFGGAAVFGEESVPAPVMKAIPATTRPSQFADSGKLVEAIIGVCPGWNVVARKVAVTGGSVFVPIGKTFDAEGLDRAICDPFNLISNEEGKEPCYASLEEGRKGKTSSGEPHDGFIKIDPITRLVTGLIDRDGKSRVKEGGVFDSSNARHQMLVQRILIIAKDANLKAGKVGMESTIARIEMAIAEARERIVLK